MAVEAAVAATPAEATDSDERGRKTVRREAWEIAERLDKMTMKGLREDTRDCPPPDREAVIEVISGLQSLLFPLCFQRENARMTDAALLERTLVVLEDQAVAALLFDRENPGDAAEEAERLIGAFARRLPEVKRLLLLDIEALYEGDPAAKRREEVVICYPGFFATTVYRLAHELYLLGLPLIPRVMTEFAHGKTGIDIHPGATIGEYFFIDHGTGIVIGETTVIGDHVKLYQGVTLGAKSFETDENGNPVKGIKRHPNIGSHVVIYANATILGGRTTIGDHCVIGGNCWVTHSVEPGRTVAYTPQENRGNADHFLWGDGI